MTRALGPIRELDVTRARLVTEAAALGWSRTATTRVDTFLGGLRRTAFADGVRVLKKTSSAGTFRELLVAVKALEQDSAIGELRAVAATRRRRRAQALADGLAGLGRLYVPDHLHAVRIAVKQLRYALEWEAALSRRTWSRERRRLEDMQDVLGEWHDLVILQMYVERATHTLARRVVPGASTMSAEMERQCRQLHARILTEVPRLASLAGRTSA
jgi:CHAD domain-containing protein